MITERAKLMPFVTWLLICARLILNFLCCFSKLQNKTKNSNSHAEFFCRFTRGHKQQFTQSRWVQMKSCIVIFHFDFVFLPSIWCVHIFKCWWAALWLKWLSRVRASGRPALNSHKPYKSLTDWALMDSLCSTTIYMPHERLSDPEKSKYRFVRDYMKIIMVNVLNISTIYWL